MWYTHLALTFFYQILYHICDTYETILYTYGAGYTCTVAMATIGYSKQAAILTLVDFSVPSKILPISNSNA